MAEVYILLSQKDSLAGVNIFLPNGRVPCIRSDRQPTEAAADWLKKRGIFTKAKPRVYKLDSKITVLYELQRNSSPGWVNAASVLFQWRVYDKNTLGIVQSFLTI